jgi:hypothetical protein
MGSRHVDDGLVRAVHAPGVVHSEVEPDTFIVRIMARSPRHRLQALAGSV